MNVDIFDSLMQPYAQECTTLRSAFYFMKNKHNKTIELSEQGSIISYVFFFF
jgi:hypothetical protein